MKTLIAAACAAFLIVPASARAVEVTYDFVAEVDLATGIDFLAGAAALLSDPFGGLGEGDRFTGSLSYDTSDPGSPSSAGSRVYPFGDITVDLPATASFDPVLPGQTSFIQVFPNLASDSEMRIFGGQTRFDDAFAGRPLGAEFIYESIGMRFIRPLGTFGTDLPESLDPAALMRFNTTLVLTREAARVVVPAGPGAPQQMDILGSRFLNSSLVSITRRTTPGAEVPLPAAGVLLAASSAALAVLRRRRRGAA
ncbi:MAG: hypothetical protein AAF763_16020 [Pseudomonadota bacterium]